ncbi:MAG: dTMP kinase [Campylobacterales bacterium]
MYLALEGVDGAGKSTQLAALKQLYPDAVFTLEPGGTPLGGKLRELVLHHKMDKTARLFLFLADRAEHAAKVIAPNEGKLIISDRSALSGAAYAWGDADHALLAAMNRLATRDRLPDRAVLLKMDEATIKTRLSHDRLDEIEKQGLDFLLSVQDRLIDAAKLLNVPLTVIDAALEPQTITKQLKELIDDHRA